MRYGISIKINVSKIEKARLFEGKNGKYLDITTFIDTDNPSEYGDHGFLSQDVSKEEREAGTKGVILGNAKVFFTAESEHAPTDQQMGALKDAVKPQQFQDLPPNINNCQNGNGSPPQPAWFDDDIPF